MAVSAAEQYQLELINRARLDPFAEAARYDLPLNTGLPAGTITGSAREVLAHNRALEQAALGHSNWMLAGDIFSHTGVNGSDPGDRIIEAGYALRGAWAWRENLAWTGTTGTLDLNAAVENHHEGLYRSAGHRRNTFSEDIREIGVAQVEGQFTQNGTAFNASMLTLKFARSGADHFLTGVTYRDSDTNAFYGIGEGQAGVSVIAGGSSTQTAAAGGYALAVRADAALDVTLREGPQTLATLEVDLSVGNVKLDVVTDADGGRALALSGSATLTGGITDATLLGVANLALTGNAADNTLTGNAGRNLLQGGDGADLLFGAAGADRLEGGRGDDVLRGGQGRDVAWDSLEQAGMATTNADTLLGGDGDDRLHGQSGRDWLDGGAGDDRLTGGGGRDTFVFTAGHDLILDFSDNVDTIELDVAALGLGTTSVADVIAAGDVTGGNALFDFGGGHSLQINGVDDLDILLNDLVIV